MTSSTAAAASSTTAQQLFRSVVSTSGIATALMLFYLYVTCRNLHQLMYPLTGLDLKKQQSSWVHPLWQQGEPMFLRVYLSTHPVLSPDFLDAGYDDNDDASEEDKDSSTTADEQSTAARRATRPQGQVDTVLLWDEKVNAPSLSKSILVTTCPPPAEDNDDSSSSHSDECRDGPSYRSAVSRLDDAERLEHQLRGEDDNDGGAGVFSVLTAAGHGIESTSLLLTFYQSVYRKIRAVLGSKHKESDDDAAARTSSPTDGTQRRVVIHLSSTSPLWKSLVNANSTTTSSSSVSLHVLLIRAGAVSSSIEWPPATPDKLRSAIMGASRTHGLLGGHVDLIKFDPPTHLRKPSRILFEDVKYLWRSVVQSLTGTSPTKDDYPPWNMQHASPEHYQNYVAQKAMKLQGQGYPYWKPEVSIKYVTDHVDYPLDYVHLSGMPIVRVAPTKDHPTGYSYTPAIHVDEIGLTSEKYVPINSTLTSLPLRITFDRSDIMDSAAEGTGTFTGGGRTGTSGGISPARWRLLSHLSQALESQKALGFDDSDIDDVRRLIADTNVTLLMVTLLASALHMLFEFLTFKNEVAFWRHNRDLTGLSVRALFMDVAGQFVILLYLVEQDSSLLVTVPSAIGCLIALWKCHRAAGFQFVRVTSAQDPQQQQQPTSWWNAPLRRLVGYELRATRLEEAAAKGRSQTGDEKNRGSDRDRLAALTVESDRIATRTLGTILLPMVLVYTVYQWMYVPHVGWYSWLVTSSSSAVYALGFVLMTPQLFLNWKLKSVAHLPWRVLVYKSLNTFIDDLFSFIIRMPTMARISCFRDDVVFFIYLYQRWLYPVDASRPVEGGVGERELVEKDKDDDGSKGNASKVGTKESKKDR